jgi:BirA family biotin operon repressor/biotin-[acetyl-CoA-carboxylase] ligase
MSQPDAVWNLDTNLIGRRVLVFDRLDSTSTCAAALARDPANDGVVILANEQTAGRGQYGRSWQCEPGTGVLMSVLLFPPPALRRPALVTAWAAVSVCETIGQCTGLQARIKWPNDVLIRGRKVCGILIEQTQGVVTGIGLNVNQTVEAFAAAGLTEAASLAFFTGRPMDCPEVARRLIGQLDLEFERMRQGDVATLEACWQGRIGLLGKQVMAECHDGMHHGRLRELGWDRLELEVAGDEVLCLAPEAVRHLNIIPS